MEVKKLGTDIYLFEEGKQEETEDAYIRASIGMREENGTLRQIFPEELWDGDDQEFDFSSAKNKQNFFCAITNYIDDEIKVEYTNDSMEKFAEILTRVVEEEGYESSIEMCSAFDTQEERIEWATTVREFYKKGLELQEQGKKMRVLISW